MHSSFNCAMFEFILIYIDVRGRKVRIVSDRGVLDVMDTSRDCESNELC